MKPNCEYSEETKSGFNTWTATVDYWSSENRKESHNRMINWQLRLTDSYDHTSTVTIMLPDHCIGAVTIILPENKSTISLILHTYRVLCLVTNDDKLQIYIVCKVYASLWHVSITIRPGPNSPSPTSAILYDRNCYDRNCFPTVMLP